MYHVRLSLLPEFFRLTINLGPTAKYAFMYRSLHVSLNDRPICIIIMIVGILILTIYIMFIYNNNNYIVIVSNLDYIRIYLNLL